MTRAFVWHECGPQYFLRIVSLKFCKINVTMIKERHLFSVHTFAKTLEGHQLAKEEILQIDETY